MHLSFGLSSDEVINYENKGGYNPMDIFNNDQEIRQVLMQLINGTYSKDDQRLFRDLYNSLLNTSADRADTTSSSKTSVLMQSSERVEEAYKDEKGWAKMAMLNTACSW